MGVLMRLRQVLSRGCVCILCGFLSCTAVLRAESAVDRECLRCHRDPSLGQAQPDGQVRALYVDPEGWKADIHYKKGFTCVDCHTDASPYAHPVGGFEKADCSACHSEDCETFERTIHASLSSTGAPHVSGCYECHTRHSVRSVDDPEASIAEKRIVGTCSSCHPEETASRSWINRLTFFRVSGHRKENISGAYDMGQCIHCHFQDGAHGQPDALAEQCAVCHTQEKGINAIFSRSVHAATVLGSGGLLTGLKALYGLIVVGLLGSLVILFLRQALGRYQKQKDSSS